jgi:hypothetical protein
MLKRRRLLIISVGALLQLIGCVSGPPATEDWVSALSGRWNPIQDEENCAQIHTISFSPDRTYMNIGVSHPIEGGGSIETSSRYRIIEVGSSSLRIEPEGEPPSHNSGNAVALDLVMHGRDQYCWNRSDSPHQVCAERTERIDPCRAFSIPERRCSPSGCSGRPPSWSLCSVARPAAAGPVIDTRRPPD